jgi:hypothetical protein
MHAVFLSNEGTVAVEVMAIAMAIAFLMVIGLGAYVLYCDALNRAEERHLVTDAGDGGHPVAAESHPVEPAPVDSRSAATGRRRRSRPPS